MDSAHHMLGTLPPPADWPLAQTGLTPYLIIDDDHNEPDVFASSFANPARYRPLQVNQSATGLKHDLSPGAASSVVQSQQLKRPKLPSTDVSSSAMSTLAQSTDSSDSPPSDQGDGRVDGLPPPPRHLLPHAVVGQPTDAAPNVVLSSQDFATLMQGYAAGAQAFHQQAAPTTATLNNAKLLAARRPTATMAAVVEPVHSVAPAAVAPAPALPTSPNPVVVALSAAQPHAHRAAAPSRVVEASDEDEPAPTKVHANPKRSHTAAANTRKKGKAAAAAAATAAVHAPPPPTSQPTSLADDPQEEKRAQFLERNRVAACKSRQKKKEWVQSLEDSADVLNRRNTEMQQIIQTQQEEIAYLRNVLAMHDGCVCVDANAPAAAQLPVVNAQTGAPRRPPPPSKVQTSFSAASSPNASFSPPASAVAQLSFADQLTTTGGALDQTRAAFDTTPGVIAFNMAQHNLSTFDYFNVGANGNSQAFSTPDLATSLGFGPA